MIVYAVSVHHTNISYSNEVPSAKHVLSYGSLVGRTASFVSPFYSFYRRPPLPSETPIGDLEIFIMDSKFFLSGKTHHIPSIGDPLYHQIEDSHWRPRDFYSGLQAFLSETPLSRPKIFFYQTCYQLTL